jgi:hypothetical protein
MSQVVNLTSFVVALAALIIAVLAWRRPFLPDPTSVPNFGHAGQPANLNDTEVMKHFFEFLREHAGRKVLLYTTLTARAEEMRTMQKDMTTEEFSTREAHDGLTDNLYVPRREDKKNAIGISYQHGSWRLRGYYANVGLVDVAQGIRQHKLIPLSDDEAVA